MHIIIESNRRTGGLCTEFNVGRKWFYADLSYTMDRGIESMIFRKSLYTDFIDFSEPVSVRYFDEVSEDNLRKHIQEFIGDEL